MRNPRYWQSGNPERKAYVDWVTRGFQALYGEGNASKAGSVWVEPYSRMRDGRKEDVSGHWRSHKPGAGGVDDATPIARRPRDDMFPKHSEGGGPMGPGGGGGGTRPQPGRPTQPTPATPAPPRPGAQTPEELASRSIPENRTSRRTYVMRVPEGPEQMMPDFGAMTAGRPVIRKAGNRGPVDVGTTADGRSVIARGSADGRPTIEIQRAGGGRTTHEFRYGEK
ncbi:hypothetical protein [Falsiroseomonas ponticola]|uniref:hypothetical protein n=1 Tax=Falsiroseomonas ponticola TaxID=2786951 RepID=UPI00193284A5|nr:hypothetical protein [Roseomonas ponticola]